MDAVNSKEELFSKRVDESRNILVESKGELCSNRVVDSRNTILPPKPSHLDIGSVQTKGEKIRQNVFGFGKRILVFTFSHVGLVCVVIGYSIFGAVIFQALESPNEIQNRVIINEIRNATKYKLWQTTKDLNIFSKVNWTQSADSILRDFQKKIYEATIDLGWDGINSEAEEDLHWSFEGALLYSVTVITTIGKMVYTS